MKQTFYTKYGKRAIDILCSLAALTVLSPLYLALIVVGAIEMKGNPFFVQPRPGKIDPKTGKERIFNLVKLRSMNSLKDENGNLLPDSQRLTNYGRFLRKSSLDEAMEVINILKGEMSVIGPRPQLVRDMLFMTDEQRKRHTVKPGLSGLAQVNGRNAISWEDKLNYDLEYIKNISFAGDAKLVLQTVGKAFIKQEGINREGFDTDEDLGDYLLRIGRVSKEEYDRKQKEAKELILNAN